MPQEILFPEVILLMLIIQHEEEHDTPMGWRDVYDPETNSSVVNTWIDRNAQDAEMYITPITNTKNRDAMVRSLRETGMITPRGSLQSTDAGQHVISEIKRKFGSNWQRYPLKLHLRDDGTPDFANSTFL